MVLSIATFCRNLALLVATFFILFFFIAFLGFQKEAHAQFVPVFDKANATQNGAIIGNLTTIAKADVALETKEFILDAILTTLAKTLIKQLSQNIIVWINSGFKDGPTFVSNPGQFFQGVGDAVAGQFIEDIGLGILCEPFKLDLKLSLNLEYGAGGTSVNEIGCTLSDVIGNVEGFLDGDFTQGGWDQWLNITQKPKNNKYGTYLAARAELDAKISHAQGIETLKLNWGDGFHSITDAIGNVLTPGKTIETQLSNFVGSDLRQLEIADEINEIIGALVGQLITQVMNTQGGGTGLSGASSGSTATYTTNGRGHTVSTAVTQAGIDYASDVQNAQNVNDQTLGDVPIFTDPCANVQDCTGAGGTATPGYNLALAGLASHISTHDGLSTRVATMANDNNFTNTEYSMTRLEVQPWWEVDLGVSSNIWKVVTTRRFGSTESAAETLGQYVVLVTDSPSGFPTTLNPLSPPPGVWSSAIQTASTANAGQAIPVPVRGRFVRIQRIESTNTRLKLVEVEVIRNEPPSIRLLSPSQLVIIPVGSPISELSAINQGGLRSTVDDAEDGNGVRIATIDTSGVNMNVPGIYTVYFRAIDSGGATNVTQTSRTIEITNSPPTITLNGGSNLFIPASPNPWIDPGATATDADDQRLGLPAPSVTAVITRSGVVVPQVIPLNPGDQFNITYSAVDSHGRSAIQGHRQIFVQ